jgi:hypothetical protein
LLKKHTRTHDRYTRKKKKEQPNKVTENITNNTQKKRKEKKRYDDNEASAHKREMTRSTEYICLFAFSSSLSLCTTSIYSKFSIFQKLVFEDKIVTFTCLPTFIVEKYISALENKNSIEKFFFIEDVFNLFIIICNGLGFFMSLKPHHMFGMKTP